MIRHAVCLHFRFSFSLSFRDVEELMAQRGIAVSYETIRCWTIKVGPLIASRLKRHRPVPSPRGHLDEMVCSFGGKRMDLWRAVDDEGEVLDVLVQRRRDTDAAMKLLKRLLHNQPVEPQTITTDGLASYGAALEQLELRPCTVRVGLVRTIGQRTHTCRSDDKNGSSSDSNPKPQPRDSSPPTRRSTTPSTFNGI